MGALYLCYVDDSGDSAGGVTMSGLLVAAEQWTSLLDRWLAARREAHATWGLPKTVELHANVLMAGRGYRDYPRMSSHSARGSLYRVMLKSVPGAGVELLSVGSASTVTHECYGLLIAALENWAHERDEYILVFYDGRELGHDGDDQDQVIRNNAHYRSAHRALPITTRRVLEDVVTQDSRFSQLMQAADLLAYGTWHLDVKQNPTRWKVDRSSKAHSLTVKEFAKVPIGRADHHHLVWHP